MLLMTLNSSIGRAMTKAYLERPVPTESVRRFSLVHKNPSPIRAKQREGNQKILCEHFLLGNVNTNLLSYEILFLTLDQSLVFKRI